MGLPAATAEAELAAAPTQFAHVAHFRADFQPVTAQNVWAYFRTSPFYDFACLNEYIAMQAADESKLQTEPGVFYKVVPQDTAVFTILKFRREVVGTRMVVTCQDGYYVYGGRIFLAPALLDVLTKKIRILCHQLAESMGNVDRMVGFDVPGGYRWRVTDTEEEEEEGNGRSKAKAPQRPKASHTEVHHAALWRSLAEAVQRKEGPPPAAAAGEARPVKRRRVDFPGSPQP
eukprot:GGOE01019176.1.p2 GENE.GGOE01019176.1~~GGOE01019176.1.p2  ORF type:complete len:231 (-),score=72.13 GGOE01019176.1:203-895(-)